MLEGRHHQHPRIVAKDVLGAVAVVHVEVDHRHPLQPVLLERVGRAHRDVVEEAESHGPAALGVMPGRAHAAEGVARLAPQITRSVACTTAPAARSAARSECGFIAVSGSRCTRPRLGHAGLERVQVVLGMHPQQLLAGRSGASHSIR